MSEVRNLSESYFCCFVCLLSYSPYITLNMNNLNRADFD